VIFVFVAHTISPFGAIKSVPAVAALTAEPFPFRSPVTEVVIAIAGVVVGVVTVPPKPFAEVTDTEVTVPEPPPPPPPDADMVVSPVVSLYATLTFAPATIFVPIISSTDS
jgi:hypothetical protein